MTGRVLSVGLGLLPALAGCLGNDKTALVSPGLSGRPPGIQQAQFAHAPATEEVAIRVATLGRKIVEANPQVGVRPTFSCIGAPQPTVFHRLSKDACEVFISEGLVKRCQTEGQLAAVLCTELGKAGSERAAQAHPAAVRPDRDPPPAAPVGTDSRGPFGSPDGTRLAELGKIDRLRQEATQPLPPPSPDILARGYLVRAGYPADDLKAVAPLLRAAEQDTSFEKQMTGRP
jgi:hypothetical protein